MNQIINFKNMSTDDVDEIIKSITFKLGDKNKYGNNNIYIKRDLNGTLVPLKIETPYLKAFIGVSQYQADVHKYSLPVSFNNLDNKEEDVFMYFVNQFDNLLIKTIFKNQSWIKKNNKDESVIKDNYTYCLRKNKDPKYLPNLNFKLPYNEQKNCFRTRVFKNKNFEYDNVMEAIVPLSQTKSIITCSNVWSVSGKFGVSWNVTHIKVQQPEVDEYIFDDDEDEDDNHNENNDNESGSDSPMI